MTTKSPKEVLAAFLNKKKVDSPKPPSVLIGVPFNRGSLEPEFMLSLINGLFDLSRNGISGSVMTQESALISISRNKIVDRCDSDYLMFIDTDIVFPAHAIRRLIKSGKDVIGGMYFKKGQGNKPVVANINPETDRYEEFLEVPDEIFECDGIGTGFLLIKKKVLDAFSQKFIKENGKPFNFGKVPGTDADEESEDWAFCRRAKKLGFKVWCDPVIRLGHIGKQIFSKESFIANLEYSKWQDKESKYENNIPGWMARSELNWLFLMAKKMDTIVEIGSWKGKSTHALCSGCKGTVYAVDHFKGSKGEERAHKEAQEKDIYEEFKKNVGHFKNLVVHSMSSLEAAKRFDDKSIDMVFIDGGHTYEEVKADIEAWLPKAKKLICGHDYNWFGIQQAVDEKFGPVDSATTIWIKKLS